MKTTNKDFRSEKTRIEKLEVLTISLVKKLKGKKIRTYCLGHNGQDFSQEFVVGELKQDYSPDTFILVDINGDTSYCHYDSNFSQSLFGSDSDRYIYFEVVEVKCEKKLQKRAKENTESFVNEVKEVLDSASWDYEASGVDNFSDIEKAVRYLDGQRFSIKSIKKALTDCWSEYRKEIYAYNDVSSHEDAVEAAAALIAETLAFALISKYKSWYIPECAHFTIK